MNAPNAAASQAESPRGLRIAVDGPAGAGKSTVSQRLAERLGYVYFDTGVLYRALTLVARRRGVDPADSSALAKLATAMRVAIRRPHIADGRTATVLLAGEDITWEIYTPQVDQHVSQVSAHPEVRAALLAQQRELAAGGAIVMAGRDIGTVVLPDADVKLFLDATIEERARRRYREQAARGKPGAYAHTLAALIRRDQLDSKRDAAPLRAAADAVVIDTTDRTVAEVVALALAAVQERVRACPTSMAGARASAQAHREARDG